MAKLIYKKPTGRYLPTYLSAVLRMKRNFYKSGFNLLDNFGSGCEYGSDQSSKRGKGKIYK